MRKINGALIALMIFSSSVLFSFPNLPFIVAQVQSSGIVITQTMVNHSIVQGETASYYFLRDEAKKYVNGVYDSSEAEYLGFDKNTYDFGFTIGGQIVARSTPVILVNVGGQWRLAVIRGGQITSSTFYSISGSDSEGDYLEIGYSGAGTFDLYTYPSLTYFTSSNAVLNKIALRYHVDKGNFQWIANVTLSQSVSNTGALLAWRSLDNQALRYVMVNGTIYDLAQVSNIPPEIMRLPASFLSDSQSITSITWDSSLLMDKGSGKISEITDLPAGYGRALLAGSYNWGSSDQIYIEDAITVTEAANQIDVDWTGEDGYLRSARFAVGSGSGDHGVIERLGFDYDGDSTIQADELAVGASAQIPFTMFFQDPAAIYWQTATIYNYYNETSGATGGDFFFLRVNMSIVIAATNKSIEVSYNIMDGHDPLWIEVNMNVSHGSDYGLSRSCLCRMSQSGATYTNSGVDNAADYAWGNYTRTGSENWETAIFGSNASISEPPFWVVTANNRLDILDTSPQTGEYHYSLYYIWGRDVDNPVGLNPSSGSAGWYNYTRDFAQADLTVSSNTIEEFVDGSSIHLEATANTAQATWVNWSAAAFSYNHSAVMYVKTNETSLVPSNVTVTGFVANTTVEIHPWNDTDTMRAAITFRYNTSTLAHTGFIDWSGVPAVVTQTLTVYNHTGIDPIIVNGTNRANGTSIVFNQYEVANITSVVTSGYIFWRYVYDASTTTSNPFYLNMTTDFVVHAYANVTIVVYLTMVWHTGISGVILNGTSVLNNSETAYNQTEVANITSTISPNFSFFYIVGETYWIHAHHNPFFWTMTANITITSYAIASGGGGVSGVSMLVLAVVGGFGLIVVAVASRKR